MFGTNKNFLALWHHLKFQLFVMIRSGGDQIADANLSSFEMLQHPGQAYELFPTQKLLQVKSQMQARLEQLTNDLCALWKQLSRWKEKEMIESCKEELAAKRQEFAAALKDFRQKCKLEVNQELFVTMQRRKDAPGALEALFAKSDKEFEESVQENLARVKSQ
jgi:hypothetical protein